MEGSSSLTQLSEGRKLPKGRAGMRRGPYQRSGQAVPPPPPPPPRLGEPAPCHFLSTRAGAGGGSVQRTWGPARPMGSVLALCWSEASGNRERAGSASCPVVAKAALGHSGSNPHHREQNGRDPGMWQEAEGAGHCPLHDRRTEVAQAAQLTGHSPTGDLRGDLIRSPGRCPGLGLTCLPPRDGPVSPAAVPLRESAGLQWSHQQCKPASGQARPAGKSGVR